jgi:hypothetical protein
MQTLACAAVAAFPICMPAIAQSPQTEPAGAPVLKGTYVITDMQNCVVASGVVNQLTGSLDFNADHGTVKIDIYQIDGNPLTMTHDTGSGTYSNTNSTFTLNGITYKVFYGRLERGIATYLSFITVENDGCGYQGWLSRQ